MRLGSAILLIWLVIGGFAAGQRGEYKEPFNCGGAATAALTILTGPLNYTGANPHINRTAPQQLAIRGRHVGPQQGLHQHALTEISDSGHWQSLDPTPTK